MNGVDTVIVSAQSYNRFRRRTILAL